jgi:hypothetical protein
MPTVNEHYGCPLVGDTATFLASMECEVEEVMNAAHVGNWHCGQDGSLRGGKAFEYTSRTPRSRENLVADFKELHKTLKLGKDPLNERTSNHVHINCSPVQMDKVRNMVLLYALYEEFFFAFVHPDRRHNIHCVPLTETYIPATAYKFSLDGMAEHWHKYTALNLGRLRDLGTLEFRHMQGTDNVQEVDQWLHILENLWRLGQKVEVDAKALMSKQTLLEWFELLFFPSARLMMLRPSMFNIIKNNLIDVKFSTVKGK